MPISFHLRQLPLRRERAIPYARRSVRILLLPLSKTTMKRTGLITALAAILGVLCAPAQLSAAARVEEKVVGPLGIGTSYGVSPRGARLATIAAQGSRQVVVVDGETSPPYDQVLGADGANYFGANSGLANPGLFPVVFSADGAHYAYAARLGTDYLILLDGKEIARGPMNNTAKLFGTFPLAFSPKGRHLVWMTTADDFSSFTLHMDGKPGPKLGVNAIEIAFNADESRHAYVSKSPLDRKTDILVVDGKVASTFARNPQFLNEGGSLVTLAQSPEKMSVLVDGKSVFEAQNISSVRLPPVGRRLAVIASKAASGGVTSSQLFLDGKAVAGTEGAQRVFISPDGKRHAVLCRTKTNSLVMVLDGVRGPEYGGIDETTHVPFFSPESTSFTYVAYNAGLAFVVTNGKESPGYQSVLGKPVASNRGGRVGYLAMESPGVFALVVDGTPFRAPQGTLESRAPIFSESGTKYVFASTKAGEMGSRSTTLYVDGKELADLEISGRVFPGRFALGQEGLHALLSDDGNHVVVAANRRADRNDRGLFLNGERVGSSFRTSYTRVAFSKDSKHLTWVAEESPGPGQKNEFALYLDGERLFRFDREHQLSQAFTASGLTWDMTDEGVIQLLAVKPEGIVRYRVTPDASVDLAKVVTRAAEARVQALADAAAAKDAAEAKAVADAAKAKADAEAAQAKRKADYDAAVAAKTKARQDATAAKAKARQDALDAAKAKKP